MAGASERGYSKSVTVNWTIASADRGRSRTGKGALRWCKSRNMSSAILFVGANSLPVSPASTALRSRPSGPGKGVMPMP